MIHLLNIKSYKNIILYKLVYLQTIKNKFKLKIIST